MVCCIRSWGCWAVSQSLWGSARPPACRRWVEVPLAKLSVASPTLHVRAESQGILGPKHLLWDALGSVLPSVPALASWAEPIAWGSSAGLVAFWQGKTLCNHLYGLCSSWRTSAQANAFMCLRPPAEEGRNTRIGGGGEVCVCEISPEPLIGFHLFLFFAVLCVCAALF